MSERPERAAQRLVVAGFGVAVLGAAGFAVAYVLGAQTQLLGLGMGLAFAGVAYGLTMWAKRLLPGGDEVEEREGLDAPRERAELAGESAGELAQRRGLLRLLGVAVGAIGVAALFPLRSLWPPGRPDPAAELSRTAWRRGVRLVTEDGQPVRPEEVTEATVLYVFPEGHSTDTGDLPAFLVRLDPGRLTAPPPGGQVRGIVAYSLLCTHAGCPVRLYEHGAGRMLCPCHQSAFDLLAGARPVAGPAARPLPGLPIELGGDGYLRAGGDFTSPPGPGYWSRP